MKKALIILSVIALVLPLCAFTVPETAHINTMEYVEAAIEIPVVIGHTLSSVLPIEPYSHGFYYLPAVFEYIR